MLFIFAALSAGAYGYHDSISGLFAALAAYRFLIGLAIGGEYPAGSVGAAESSGELKIGIRNRWFIWATDCAIDLGFVVAAFVPMIVVRIPSYPLCCASITMLTIIGACYHRESSSSCLAHLPRTWYYPTSVSSLFPHQAA